MYAFEKHEFKGNIKNVVEETRGCGSLNRHLPVDSLHETCVALNMFVWLLPAASLLQNTSSQWTSWSSKGKTEWVQAISGNRAVSSGSGWCTALLALTRSVLNMAPSIVCFRGAIILHAFPSPNSLFLSLSLFLQGRSRQTTSSLTTFKKPIIKQQSRDICFTRSPKCSNFMFAILF